MDLQNEKIIIVAGRPGSGRTRYVTAVAEAWLREGRPVVFYHAEGPEKLEDSPLEFRSPDELAKMTYISDLFTSLDDLMLEMKNAGNDALLVVHSMELLDCPHEDLIARLRNQIPGTGVALLVTTLPQRFESKHFDFSEEFIRKKFELLFDERVVILGEFPVE